MQCPPDFRSGCFRPSFEYTGMLEVSLDLEYWLANCHDFLVDSEDGEEIGVVDDVELEHGSGHPVALLVACGWFGRHVRPIPVEHVRAIFPGEMRVVVRDVEALNEGARSRA
jgi:sporulation protein YlmC with PRC-barrel domain